MKTKNIKKKIMRILKTILKKGIVSLFLLCALYNFIYVAFSIVKQERHLNFFGIRFYIIDANGMKPEFKQNELLVLKKVSNKDLDEGEVIVYLGDGGMRLRRVVKANKDKNGTVFYTTKGDNNYYIDVANVTIDKVQGKVIRHFNEKTANVINVLRSPYLTLVILIILGLS